MTRKEVLERLCALRAMVAEKEFKWEHPADCFCSRNSDPDGYSDDGKVLEFIEEAVKEKLERREL